MELGCDAASMPARDERGFSAMRAFHAHPAKVAKPVRDLTQNKARSRTAISHVDITCRTGSDLTDGDVVPIHKAIRCA